MFRKVTSVQESFQGIWLTHQIHHSLGATAICVTHTDTHAHTRTGTHTHTRTHTHTHGHTDTHTHTRTHTDTHTDTHTHTHPSLFLHHSGLFPFICTFLLLFLSMAVKNHNLKLYNYLYCALILLLHYSVISTHASASTAANEKYKLLNLYNRTIACKAKPFVKGVRLSRDDRFDSGVCELHCIYKSIICHSKDFIFFD